MNDSSRPRRLIEWTGERFVPWGPDIQVAYEHMHRYCWAAELTAGRRVLDVGSGEGYGAAILASAAESVVGIEIDEATVEHSRLNYKAENLEFLLGSALDLRSLEPDSFDVVVAFEVIEHLAEQEQMLDEIKRVLRPGGLLVMSTPDRRSYTAGGPDGKNPFHVRELSLEELEGLLDSRFGHVRLWGQRTITGSRIASLDKAPESAASSFVVERSGERWVRCEEPPPVYLVAVASEAEREVPELESTLVDPRLELLRAAQRESATLRRERDAAVSNADVTNRERLTLRSERDRLYRWGADAHAELQRPSSRAFGGLRAGAFRIIGEDSRLTRALRRTIAVALNLARRRPRDTYVESSLRAGRARAKGRITFPSCPAPIASLIIPVHAQPDLTEACLRSIVANTVEIPYEVIIVNDTADEENSRLLRSVRNARLIVNESNLGFTRSINRGAAEARGRYLVLCNNDLQIEDEGWLEALVECAESAPDIGVVAPKFLYPDGRLNEAGGIAWRDGTCANFGRGEDPHHPVFNYRREIDYASAAALLVDAELWTALGGFDERFAPAYYEDTDLCFGARELGWRVMYEPAAEVIHVEGSTMGTEVEVGYKRNQELNRPKFTAKWGKQLEGQPPRAETLGEIRAARDRVHKDHVLVFDHRIPSPDVDSGSVRMMHMLRALRSFGCSVTFVPENLVRWEPYARQLQSMGIEVLYEPVDVRGELEQRGQDVRLAIMSRPTIAMAYIYWVRELAPRATLAYDTVDLHFVREQRRAEFDPHAERIASSMREIELALIRACDVTICVSEAERRAVLGEVPDATVEVISNAHEPATEVPPAEGRAGLVFVGGFEHLPNIDAARYLVETIMPLVWEQLDDVELRIVGSRTPEEVRALASDRVTVTGWVEEIGPVLDDARAMVAPLRFGAGVKGKVTQSIARGLPVVTTTLGAEGIDAADGREMLIADRPPEFAEGVVRVCTDDELWATLSDAGRRLAERDFSVEAVTDRMQSLLNGSSGVTGRRRDPVRTRTSAGPAGSVASARRTLPG